MAKKKKVSKTKKPRVAAKSKKAAVKKKTRPTMKPSARKNAPKKSTQIAVVPKSKAAAAGANRGIQTRYSGGPPREEADDLELENSELDFEETESSEDLLDDVIPPEYGGEN